MAAIIYPPADPNNPIRLINCQTLGAMCGRFPSHEAAEAELRRRGYPETEFWREGNTVVFLGGINC